MVHGLFNRIEFEKSLDYLVRNIIFVFQMKNSIPRYTFYKNKYGSELLVDVVELKYVKKFLAESAIHTLNYYDVTFITKLFRELHLLTGTGELCFPGRHSASQCISDMALLNGIRRMGFSKEEMTIHGFRAMFSTILNEKKLEWGFDGDIIEAQLAHKEQNTVRDAYNHASYLDKRRELLQRWADYLDELRNQDTSNSLK